MNWISSSVGSAVEQFAGVIRLDLSNALGGLQQQSRAIRIAIFVLPFGLTAWLDLVVDHNLSVSCLSDSHALLSMVLRQQMGVRKLPCWGVVWFVNDRPGWYSYHYTLIPYGNLAGKLLVLALIVAIVNPLKDAFEDQYEAERRVVIKEMEVES